MFPRSLLQRNVNALLSMACFKPIVVLGVKNLERLQNLQVMSVAPIGISRGGHFSSGSGGCSSSMTELSRVDSINPIRTLEHSAKRDGKFAL